MYRFNEQSRDKHNFTDLQHYRDWISLVFILSPNMPVEFYGQTVAIIVIQFSKPCSAFREIWMGNIYTAV